MTTRRPADFEAGLPKVAVDAAKVEALIAARLAARNAKDFKESDRLRDELAGLGVHLEGWQGPQDRRVRDDVGG